MRAIHYLGIGAALVAMSPVVYSAPTQQSRQACIDRFVNETLEGRSVDVRISNYEYVMPTPLALRMEMPLQLTATDRATGRTIATARCDRDTIHLETSQERRS